MNQKEREDYKKLREEAKRKEEEEEGENWVYRVRAPPWARKIVKLQKDRPQ